MLGVFETGGKVQIVIAENAGFCFGVKRTLSMAEDAVAKYGKVYSYGPLIHNPQEIERLKNEQVIPIDDITELPEEQDSRYLIIRSHGVGPEVIEKAKAMGLEVIDATCTFVRKAQILAGDLAEEGYQVIIIGDKDHPEVIGLVGWAGHDAIVIENEIQAMTLPNLPRIGVVVQTTQTEENFSRIIKVLGSKTSDLKVHKTICNATEKTQNAALKLQKNVDLMLVIGGKNSSNTKKLAQICASGGVPTYHIETAEDILPGIFRGVEKVGITAGASTPDWIIEEVILKMAGIENNVVDDIRDTESTVANESAAEIETEILIEEAAPEDAPYEGEEEAPLGEQPDNIDTAEDGSPEENEGEQKFDDIYGGSITDVRRGARVKGVIVQVKMDELLVDIGGKSEGIVPSAELLDSEAKNIQQVFHVGDEIEVLILRKENQEGYPVLSKRRIDQELLWDKLEEAKKEGQILTGKVAKVVKGGLLVDLGIRGFIPASLVSNAYVEDLSSFVNHDLKVKVIECERNNNKLVLSAKAVLIDESKKNKEKTWENIAVGDIRHGVVRRLTKFGAFIDLGGVDGLLHVSEMAWYRVNQPSDILKEGDEIDVTVLNLDRENEKISLGLKQLKPTPWSTAEAKYPQGSIIQAKVVRLAPFGAFVEVEPGVEGLIHISQLANERVEKTEDVVKPGDLVSVKVLSVDSQAKRISLSIKATLPPIIKDSFEIEAEAETDELKGEIGLGPDVSEEVPAPDVVTEPEDEEQEEEQEEDKPDEER